MATTSLDRYHAATAQATTLALEDLDALWQSLDLTHPDQARDLLLDYYPALASRYGDLSALAALDWFTQERARIQGLPEYVPTLPEESVPLEQAQGSVRAAAGHLYGGAADDTRRALAASLGRAVANAGRAVIARNCRLDPAHPRWARVPRGPVTCAFCTVMASRGWVYKAGDESKKFHDHCDCALVPSWKAQETYLKGYDPDRMYGRYQEARQAVERAGGNPNDLRAITAAMRRAHPEEYKDGVAVPRSSRASSKVQAEVRASRAAGKAAPSTKTGGLGGGGKPPRRPMAGAAADDPGRASRRASGVRVPKGLRLGDHELATADHLARNGFDVEMLPIDNTPGVRNPDALVDGQVWEFKAPRGASERNTVADQFKKAGKQASRLVLDLRRSGLDDQVALRQAERRFYGQKKISSLIVITHDGLMHTYSL